MSVYAKQIDFLLNGYRDPTTDVILAGGKVTTKLANTSTESALWTDRNKGGSATNPIILGSDGTAEVYGDGIYDFVITDSDDNPVDTISGIEYSVESDGVDNLDDLKANPGTNDGETIYLKGRDTTGDGGQGHFYWSAADESTNVTADTQSGVYVAPDSDATGASGAWVRFSIDVLNVKWFGAKGDNSNADATGIQAAIDALPRSGGTVFMPAGIYLIDTTILITDDQTRLEGSGNTYIFWPLPIEGTTLKWNGAAGGTVVRLVPSSATLPVTGVSLKSFSIDGDLIADHGLLLESAVQCVYEDIMISACTDAALKGTGSEEVGYTGNLTVSHSSFRNIYIDQRDETAGVGMLLTGTGDDNSAFTVNNFETVSIYHHTDHDGIVFDRADTNSFQNFRTIGTASGGTGFGIRFKAVDSGPQIYGNYFMNVACTKSGIISEGTGSGAFPPQGNWIFGLLLEPGTPKPVINTGSLLSIFVGRDASGLGETSTGTINSLIAENNTDFMSAYDNGTNTIQPIMRYTTIDELLISTATRIEGQLAINNNNISTGNITGGIIGVLASEKLAFWGASPVIQQANIADTGDADLNAVKDLLRTLGLMAAS